MFDYLQINHRSSTPKYLQIYNGIIKGIEDRALIPGDKLPSLGEVCIELEVSQQTVERAYNMLKEAEVISAVHGKGYYIKHTTIGRNLKVLLLFNKLSVHKKIIYDSFAEMLGPDIFIDLFIYNNDIRWFKSIFQTHIQGYTHYVIIPHFYEHENKATELINTLPKKKLIVLDKLIEGLTGEYSAVYQNFEKDLIGSLTEALPLLRKYTTLNIIFPANTYHPQSILNGFYKFCYQHGFENKVVRDVKQLKVQPGHAYLNLMEEDLVVLVKKIKESAFQIGQDVGILSYNETPLKEILLDGITVISTDFAQMGKTAAQLILNDAHAHVENPFHLVVRNSL